MSLLTDFYTNTHGEAAKEHGNSWNGPCPFCGGKDRFIIWPERDENLGETCENHKISGIWACRQCGKSGDTIAYLMEAEGMTFREACAELGLKPAGKAPRRTPKSPRKCHLAAFEPRTASRPSELWQDYAAKLLSEARANLTSSASALNWLARRGIGKETAERFKLGYLSGEDGKSGRYRDRKALGLSPTKVGRDGKERRNIFIPRGIVIPAFDNSGRIVRLRIRRPKPDVQAFGDKYMVLEGSSPIPLLIEASGSSRLLSVFVVVEAELDAMLISQEADGQVGAFAALTNLGKPDASQHQQLKDAARILVALDYDTPKPVTKPDGTKVMESAGANGWAWWRETYPSARRWPVPSGKDPGEAFEKGVDLRAWIAAGLPPSISLRPSASASGALGGFASGMETSGGKGGTARAAAVPGSGAERKRTEQSVDPLLLELRDKMRAVPHFAFIKTSDSLEFVCDEEWSRASETNWNLVRALEKEIIQNDLYWAYLMEHPAERMTADNLITSEEDNGNT